MRTHYQCYNCKKEIPVKLEITERYMEYIVVGANLICKICGTTGRVIGTVYYEDIKQVDFVPAE